MGFSLCALLLLWLDVAGICGESMRDGTVAFEGESTRDNTVTFQDENTRTENTQQDLDESLYTEMLNGTSEDDSSRAQDSLYRYSQCDEEMLKHYGEVLCWEMFHINMSALGQDNWCNMDMVVRSYNKLTECVESVSSHLRCYYPNPVVERLFVRIHQQYFSSCSGEEDLADAPAGVVLVGTLLPILLIPFIVYIVVWKSSLRD